MTRYSAGVYTIVNRKNGGAESAVEYILDNQRYQLPADSMVTIEAFNWIGFTDTSETYILKLGQSSSQVIGNSTIYNV